MTMNKIPDEILIVSGERNPEANFPKKTPSAPAVAKASITPRSTLNNDFE